MLLLAHLRGLDLNHKPEDCHPLVGQSASCDLLTWSPVDWAGKQPIVVVRRPLNDPVLSPRTRLLG